jgi:ubiquinone/menaquinone biosynthesis C-methylase UbiE
MAKSGIEGGPVRHDASGGIIRILHEIASRPFVYNCIQRLAGQKLNLAKISAHTRTMDPCTVVDVGGGTGAARNLWPAGSRYICLDIEMPKLELFRSKNPNTFALLSDATRMSIATGSTDVLLYMCFTHHLTDEMLDQAFREAVRVLRVGGRLILLDAILKHERRIGRILWKLDRGSYPHTSETLYKKLGANFRIVHWEQYAIYHEYAFGIGVRR